MKQSLSWLQCIACNKTFATDRLHFRCTCGDLLSVRHDLDQIISRHGDLKAIFENRLGQKQPPYASGVWRYHELILPDLPVSSIISMPEGNTPLYRRKAIEKYVDINELYVKHEGENPTLSFKDRGMTAGVSWAQHVGAKRVACASTGDTSAAMACYAASAGLSAVVLLPHKKVSIEQLAQPICYGSRVLALETDFDGCMAIVKQLTADGEIYLLNSMNPFRIEGQKAIGIETIHMLNWQVPDWFLIPVGNAGNISALGKGLLELHEMGLIKQLPRIAGVQVNVADPLYRSFADGFKQRIRVKAGVTVASAIRIGDPVSFDKAKAVVEQLQGVITEVTDADAMQAKAVVDGAGVHICPNSAVAIAGARRLRSEGVISQHETVVAIATAHGNKFSKAAMDFHTNQTLNEFRSNPPQIIKPDLDLVRQALPD